ncbi:alpha/beta fold hydrolase [Bradyrhizobium sp. CCBAU 51627]|uniref:alpha/beta fold hydrolase n=1 Tax=Bradyrhizobium sp. CCBAU 51627 TaxID=1325088 RepID=UPI003FA4BC8E
MKLGRLIVFDRRGIGLSDRVGSAPDIDVTAEDIGTVLQAAQSRHIVLFGASECGPACVKFAVDQPRRVATWRAGSPAPSSSSSTAMITGSLPVISGRCSRRSGGSRIL